MPDTHLEAEYESRTDLGDDERMHPGEENQAGWPGDGSGEDDLADYNQNEADDYSAEGASGNGDYEGNDDGQTEEMSCIGDE